MCYIVIPFGFGLQHIPTLSVLLQSIYPMTKKKKIARFDWYQKRSLQQVHPAVQALLILSYISADPISIEILLAGRDFVVCKPLYVYHKENF